MKMIFKQLPDLHTDKDLERYGLMAYGRFGLFQDSSLWFGNHHSSHPRELLVGWYWGIDLQGNLLLSTRNVNTDLDKLQADNYRVVNQLYNKLIRQGLLASH